MLRKYRVLLVHNFYQQSGGEDAVFAAERDMLLSHGHEVVVWTDTNNRLDQISKVSAASNAVWSSETLKKAKEIIMHEHLDVVHVHNTWMMFSPSIYYAFHKHGIPVVQTLHNYRLLCLNALLFRDNKVCEDCLSFHAPWPGIFHKCYRKSLGQTAVAAMALSYHRTLATWRKQVDIFIALSEFSRNKFIQGGLPPEKLVVKSNFLPDISSSSDSPRDYVLYAGRLSPEKGVEVLMQAWCLPMLSNIPLHIAGDGPEIKSVLRLAEEKKNVHYLGQLSRSDLDVLISQSKFVVIPSVWYENFPMSILDAFRLGIPVIASRLGSLAEIIDDGETGFLFNPNDAHDLAAKVNWLWVHPEEARRMGRAARLEYENKYTPGQNHQQLMKIYERAIKEKKK